ncbi:hypothetical protein [Bradyrhizobium sp. ISRA464]|uniref:hypothetical protein n=1 Tax=Bradyrhizobium sp. ISRA464 TaxID=2866200 RepID=UPI002478C393|nr:hypothetical protein [Bradyrhizobium sp. ISRA464]WGS26897.1 hypothetical protein MTX19_35475 [Bradyrhizobium sp. ISRA464]
MQPSETPVARALDALNVFPADVRDGLGPLSDDRPADRAEERNARLGHMDAYRPTRSTLLKDHDAMRAV